MEEWRKETRWEDDLIVGPVPISHKDILVRPLRLIYPEMYSVLFTSSLLCLSSKPLSQMTILFDLLHISTIVQGYSGDYRTLQIEKLGTRLVPNNLQQMNDD